jgi:pyrimidine nucleoside transport protein
MGVEVDDCRQMAQLMGVKTFLNEYIAYQQLGILIDNREQLHIHKMSNGTWYHAGDDVMLIHPEGNETVLVNGVVSVCQSS